MYIGRISQDGYILSMTAKYSTFPIIYRSCLSMLYLFWLTVALWQQHVASSVSVMRQGKTQTFDWDNQIKVHSNSGNPTNFGIIDDNKEHTRERRAILRDVLPEDAPCYNKGGGGGGSVDYEIMDTRKGKYKAMGSKLKSIKNKLKKGKFSGNHEEEQLSERRTRRQVEEGDLPGETKGIISNAAKQIAERVEKTWLSLKDTIKRFSEKVGEQFRSSGSLVMDRYEERMKDIEKINE